MHACTHITLTSLKYATHIKNFIHINKTGRRAGCVEGGGKQTDILVNKGNKSRCKVICIKEKDVKGINAFYIHMLQRSKYRLCT